MLVSDMVNISPAPERTGDRIILYAPPCMTLDQAHFTKTKELFYFFIFFIFLQRCAVCVCKAGHGCVPQIHFGSTFYEAHIHTPPCVIVLFM